MVQAVSTGSASCNGTLILDECDLGDPDAYNSLQMEIITAVQKLGGEGPVDFDCAVPSSYDQLCRAIQAAIASAGCDADQAVFADLNGLVQFKICINGVDRVISLAELAPLFGPSIPSGGQPGQYLTPDGEGGLVWADLPGGGLTLADVISGICSQMATAQPGDAFGVYCQNGNLVSGIPVTISGSGGDGGG